MGDNVRYFDEINILGLLQILAVITEVPTPTITLASARDLTENKPKNLATKTRISCSCTAI